MGAVPAQMLKLYQRRYERQTRNGLYIHAGDGIDWDGAGRAQIKFDRNSLDFILARCYFTDMLNNQIVKYRPLKVQRLIPGEIVRWQKKHS